MQSIKISTDQGAWVTQLVGCLTLGFGSGPDLRVVRFSPALGAELSAESP